MEQSDETDIFLIEEDQWAGWRRTRLEVSMCRWKNRIVSLVTPLLQQFSLTMKPIGFV